MQHCARASALQARVRLYSAWHVRGCTHASKVAVVPALSWFICCICAAFVGGHFRSGKVFTFPAKSSLRSAIGLRCDIAQPCAPSSPRICAPPCSPYACASILRLARPARLRRGGAHAVCMCCAQACDVAQARVQGGGLGVWDAAGEGWDGQGSQCTCASAGELHVNSQNLASSSTCCLCRASRVADHCLGKSGCLWV